jgi:molecular chaperone DnaK
MDLLMQTPQVAENAEGTRTTPSIVARNLNDGLLIDVTVSRSILSAIIRSNTFDEPQTQKEMKMMT